MQGLVPEETAAESWKGSKWVDSHLQLKVFWLLVQVPVSLEKHLKWQPSTEFTGLGCWGIKLAQLFCSSKDLEEAAYLVARAWLWGVPHHHLHGSSPKGLNTDLFPGKISRNIHTNAYFWKKLAFTWHARKWLPALGREIGHRKTATWTLLFPSTTLWLPHRDSHSVFRKSGSSYERLLIWSLATSTPFFRPSIMTLDQGLNLKT